MMFYLTGDIRYTIATAIVYHFLINYITGVSYGTHIIGCVTKSNTC